MLVAGVHVHGSFLPLPILTHTAVGTIPRAENVKGVASACRATLWKGDLTHKKMPCVSKALVGLTVGPTPQVGNHILNTGPPPLALGNSNHVYTFEML